MPKYHVTPDNRRLRCDAKRGGCKYGSANHFPTARAADDYLALQAEVLAAKPAKPVPAQVKRALTARLGYRGEKPQWWQARREHLADNPHGLDFHLELLDVLRGPHGKIAVTWQRDTEDKTDFYLENGLVTQNIILRDYETGRSLGYVRFEYMDDASITRSFGNDELTPLRYRVELGGRGYYYDEADLTVDPATLPAAEAQAVRTRLWVAAHQDMEQWADDAHGERVEPRNVTAAHAPKDPEILRAELADLTALAATKMNETRERLTVPLVSFAKLERELKGQGLGSAMYIYAARKLAQQGMTFRSSDTQSGDGAAIWQRLGRHFPEHVKPYTYRWMGQTKRAQTLDFR